MLHPDAKLRNSRIEGKGLIAGRFIPKGTIFWKSSSRDRLRTYSMAEYRKFSRRYRDVIDRFSYPDESGNVILSLDDDKHWNHSCNANVLDALDKPMCIVVQDIQPGEEITYDYGLNLRKDLVIHCNCNQLGCRKLIKRASKDSALYKYLLLEEKSAVRFMNKVWQPLLK
jgi:SET domain-containing protein